MNPRPRYSAGKLAALPPLDPQAIGLLAHASGLQTTLWKELSLKEPAAVALPSGLHSLALRRYIVAVTAKKKRPSFITPGNHLALILASRIEHCVKAILQVDRAGARVRLREIEPNVPEKEQPRFLKLLREASDNPISASNRKIWRHLLTETAMILDLVEQFPELKRVRLAKGSRFIKDDETRFRSGLLNYFNKTLKNLLG